METQEQVATLKPPIQLEIIKTYKYRIRPTKKQVVQLEATLDTCRWLYNNALQHRKDTYTTWKMRDGGTKQLLYPFVTYKSQSKDLTQIKADFPELNRVYDKLLRETLQRVDLAFAAFYRRLKKGEKAGYPRFKSKNRYNSFTYRLPANPDAEGNYNAGGWKLQNKRLTLQMGKESDPIGGIKIKLHRPLTAGVRTLNISRNNLGEWYACFCVKEIRQVERMVTTLAEAPNPIGIAMGLGNLITLSNGEAIENPAYYSQFKAKLAKAQQAVASKEVAKKAHKVKEFNRNCRNLKKARRKVAKLHAKIANKRRDNLHKLSRELVKRFDALVVGDYNIPEMVEREKAKIDEEKSEERGNITYAPNNQIIKTNYNRAILDAGWGMLTTYINYKAEEAGKLYITVNPENSSQKCSNCGGQPSEKLKPSVQLYQCESCGFELERGWNTAKNIFTSQFGESCVEGIRPSG